MINVNILAMHLLSDYGTNVVLLMYNGVPKNRFISVTADRVNNPENVDT